MKKYFIPLIIAGIVAGCGNKNSAAADATSDGNGEAESQKVEAKQLYAPGNISTPYSISDVPVMDVDIVTITLDNGGRAHLAFRGDGASGISTKKLRRMVAMEALLSSGIDRAEITEEQLANFVALDDIGMTVQQWRENYHKPLAQLKSINGNGIMPQTDDNSPNMYVRDWLRVIQMVLYNVDMGSSEQDYSLTPVCDADTDEVDLSEIEEAVMEEEEEVVVEEDPFYMDGMLWNTNTMPESTIFPLGFNTVIIADKECPYSFIDRLLCDIRIGRAFKFMTSQFGDKNDGGWCLSFRGAGDGWDELYRIMEVNIDPIASSVRTLFMIVDNKRDSSGQPINYLEDGHRQFVAKVWNGNHTINEAQDYEFVDCRLSDEEPVDGLPKILHQRNQYIREIVKQWRGKLYRNEISAEEYRNSLNKLPVDFENDSRTLIVLIKMAPSATYEAFVAAINEMYINNVLYWRIISSIPE